MEQHIFNMSLVVSVASPQCRSIVVVVVESISSASCDEENSDMRADQ